jgi:hypothetical protein
MQSIYSALLDLFELDEDIRRMLEASRPSPRLNSTFDEKRLDISSNGLLRGWLAIQARELIEQIVVTHRRRDPELDKGEASLAPLIRGRFLRIVSICEESAAREAAAASASERDARHGGKASRERRPGR